MKIIRAIHGKTLRDKIHSDQLRQLSGIQGIIKWANVRRREWDAHVERMEDNRLAKIARDNRPRGVRSRGRSKKCWKESLNMAPSLKLWNNRRQPIEEEEEEEENKNKKKKRKKTLLPPDDGLLIRPKHVEVC
jgi:hypothetical protein